eukprot:gene11537-7957_t
MTHFDTSRQGIPPQDAGPAPHLLSVRVSELERLLASEHEKEKALAKTHGLVKSHVAHSNRIQKDEESTIEALRKDVEVLEAETARLRTVLQRLGAKWKAVRATSMHMDLQRAGAIGIEGGDAEPQSISPRDTGARDMVNKDGDRRRTSRSPFGTPSSLDDRSAAEEVSRHTLTTLSPRSLSDVSEGGRDSISQDSGNIRRLILASQYSRRTSSTEKRRIRNIPGHTFVGSTSLEKNGFVLVATKPNTDTVGRDLVQQIVNYSAFHLSSPHADEKKGQLVISFICKQFSYCRRAAEAYVGGINPQLEGHFSSFLFVSAGKRVTASPCGSLLQHQYRKDPDDAPDSLFPPQRVEAATPSLAGAAGAASRATRRSSTSSTGEEEAPPTLSIVAYFGGLGRLHHLVPFFLHFSRCIASIVCFCQWSRGNENFHEISEVTNIAYFVTLLVACFVHIFFASVMYMWAWRFCEPEEVAKRRCTYGAMMDLFMGDIPNFVVETKIVYRKGFASKSFGVAYTATCVAFLYTSLRVWMFLLQRIAKWHDVYVSQSAPPYKADALKDSASLSFAYRLYSQPHRPRSATRHQEAYSETNMTANATRRSSPTEESLLFSVDKDDGSGPEAGAVDVDAHQHYALFRSRNASTADVAALSARHAEEMAPDSAAPDEGAEVEHTVSSYFSPFLASVGSFPRPFSKRYDRKPGKTAGDVVKESREMYAPGSPALPIRGILKRTDGTPHRDGQHRSGSQQLPRHCRPAQDNSLQSVSEHSGARQGVSHRPRRRGPPHSPTLEEQNLWNDSDASDRKQRRRGGPSLFPPVPGAADELAHRPARRIGTGLDHSDPHSGSTSRRPKRKMFEEIEVDELTTLGPVQGGGDGGGRWAHHHRTTSSTPPRGEHDAGYTSAAASTLHRRAGSSSLSATARRAGPERRATAERSTAAVPEKSFYDVFSLPLLIFHPLPFQLGQTHKEGHYTWISVHSRFFPQHLDMTRSEHHPFHQNGLQVDVTGSSGIAIVRRFRLVRSTYRLGRGEPTVVLWAKEGGVAPHGFMFYFYVLCVLLFSPVPFCFFLTTSGASDLRTAGADSSYYTSYCRDQPSRVMDGYVKKRLTPEERSVQLLAALQQRLLDRSMDSATETGKVHISPEIPDSMPYQGKYNNNDDPLRAQKQSLLLPAASRKLGAGEALPALPADGGLAAKSRPADAASTPTTAPAQRRASQVQASLDLVEICVTHRKQREAAEAQAAAQAAALAATPSSGFLMMHRQRSFSHRSTQGGPPRSGATPFLPAQSQGNNAPTMAAPLFPPCGATTSPAQLNTPRTAGAQMITTRHGSLAVAVAVPPSSSGGAGPLVPSATIPGTAASPPNPLSSATPMLRPPSQLLTASRSSFALSNNSHVTLGRPGSNIFSGTGGSDGSVGTGYGLAYARLSENMRRLSPGKPIASAAPVLPKPGHFAEPVPLSLSDPGRRPHPPPAAPAARFKSGSAASLRPSRPGSGQTDDRRPQPARRGAPNPGANYYASSVALGTAVFKCVRRGADILYKSQQLNEEPPLHYLIRHASLHGVAACLLSIHHPIDFTVTDSEGNTAFHAVCESPRHYPPDETETPATVAAGLLTLLLQRLHAHHLDEVQWGQKNFRGLDFAALAYESGKSSLFWPTVQNEPFFFDVAGLMPEGLRPVPALFPPPRRARLNADDTQLSKGHLTDSPIGAEDIVDAASAVASRLARDEAQAKAEAEMEQWWNPHTPLEMAKLLKARREAEKTRQVQSENVVRTIVILVSAWSISSRAQQRTFRSSALVASAPLVAPGLSPVPAEPVVKQLLSIHVQFFFCKFLSTVLSRMSAPSHPPCSPLFRREEPLFGDEPKGSRRSPRSCWRWRHFASASPDPLVEYRNINPKDLFRSVLAFKAPRQRGTCWGTESARRSSAAPLAP